MQISRHMLLACAVAALAIPTLVHAADNEAQIRARQALEDKMQQITPAAPTNPAPVVSKPKPVAQKPVVQKPAPPIAPKATMVESQPAPSTPSRVYTSSTDAATQQKLQDALHQAQPAPTPVVAEPVPKPVVPKPAPKAVVTEPAQPAVTVAPSTPPVQSQPPPSTPAYVTTPSNDNATEQKLQDALQQKMQQTPVEPAPVVTTQKPAKPMKPAKPAPAPTPAPVVNAPPAHPAPKTAATKPAPAPTPAPASTANYAPVPEPNTAHPTLPAQPTPAPTPAPAHVASKEQQPVQPSTALPPLTGPATGLSPAKEQKLSDLLQQYRADQITPEQYHEQRAKILAEP